jgi:hypothetical protein
MKIGFKKGISVAVIILFLTNYLGACGTILYPERKVQVQALPVNFLKF